MKSIIFFCCFFIVLFASCVKKPEASFTVTVENSWTYENIFLHNLSVDAEAYSWDFGNGQYSYEDSPILYYPYQGEYTITLTAFSKKNKNKDIYTQTIEIVQPTDLSIKIFKDTYDPESIEGAKVTIYKSYEDWLNYTNALDSEYSDNNGFVLFRNLDTISYYVDIFKMEGNGFWANWDSGYKTDTLVYHEINNYPVYLKFFIP